MSDFQNAVDNAAPVVEQTFGSEPQTPATTQPQVVTLEDGSIVVNGKIFKPEAAAKKIVHADQHIQTLEQENAEKDEKTLALLDRIEALEAARKKEDALDRLVAQQSAPVVPEPAPAQEISKEDLVQSTLDTIKAQQVAEQQQANLNVCVAEAQKQFGDNFGTVIDAKAVEYGMSVDDSMEMAKNNPVIFKQLFIPAGGDSFSPDTTRSTATPLGAQQAPVKRKSYMNMSSKERIAEVNRRMAAYNQGT